jgi:hypothetical protein
VTIDCVTIAFVFPVLCNLNKHSNNKTTKMLNNTSDVTNTTVTSRQNEVLFIILSIMYTTCATFNALCNIVIFIIVHRDKIIHSKPGIALIGVLSLSDAVIGLGGLWACVNRAFLYYTQVCKCITTKYTHTQTVANWSTVAAMCSTINDDTVCCSC